ncbi:MAG: T9SS type A sorting domain-containing protein [Bacteroidota bacterium]
MKLLLSLNLFAGFLVWSHLGYTQVSTFTAQTSGNWSLATTWSGVGSDADGIPDADDTVIIPADFTVRLTQNSSCDDLVIEFRGILLFQGFGLTIQGGDIFADIGKTTTLYLSNPNGNGNFNSNSNWLNGSRPPTTGGATKTCSVPFYISSSFSQSFPDIFEGDFTVSTEGAMVMKNNSASFRSNMKIGGSMFSTSVDQFIDDNITIYGPGSIDLSGNDLVLGTNYSLTIGESNDIAISGGQIIGTGGTNNVTVNGNSYFNIGFSNIDQFTLGTNTNTIFSLNPGSGIASWDVDQTGSNVKYAVNSGGQITLPANVVYYSFSNTSSVGIVFNDGNDILSFIEILGPTTFNGTVDIGGDWKQFGGAVTQNGTINFNGTSNQAAFSLVESPITFNNLTVDKSAGLLSFSDNVQVSTAFNLLDGVINMNGKILTLGTSPANPGTLTYVSGGIAGGYEKYFAASDPGVEYFPFQGTQAPVPFIFSIDFGTITTGGSILMVLNTNNPGTGGLPVTISGSTLYNTFVEGFASIIPLNSFATSAAYTVTGSSLGLVSFPFDTDVRMLVRGASGLWSDGGQSSGISDGVSTVTGNDITESLPIDIALGSSLNCTAVAADAISGDTQVCTDDVDDVYSVTQQAMSGTSTFFWTVVGGTIDEAGGASTYLASGATSITVDWGSTGHTGSIRVQEQSQGCGFGSASSLSVTIGSIAPASILGQNEVAEEGSGLVYTLSDEITGYTYDWSVTGGTITSEVQTGGSPASATVTWDVAGEGTVNVTATDGANGCPASASVIKPVLILIILDTDNNGQWRNQGGSRWETGYEPTDTESARINNDIFLDQNETIRTLIIPSAGSLDLSGFTLTVTKNLEVSGSIVGPGTINLAGDGLFLGNPLTTIGTIADNVDVNIISSRTFTSGSQFSMVGDLTISDNVSVINDGTLIVDGNVNSSTNSKLINDTGTQLAPTLLEVTGGTFMPAGTLTASANYNTVRYSSASPTSQTIVVPFNSKYFNLELSGTGTKSLNGLSLNVLGDFISTATDITETGSTLAFNGTLDQTISLTNDQVLNNITINKASGALTLSSALDVAGVLTLTNGIVSNGNNLLSITNCAVGGISGGGDASYVDGILERCLNGSISDVFNFPVGTAGDFKRAELIQETAGRSDYTIEPFNNAYSDITSLTAPLINVSGLEYWDINQTFGSGDVSVRLYWDVAMESGINDFTDLRIAHYTGGTWVDKEQGGQLIGNPGYVQSNLVFTSFSPVTFGSASATENPLPVELLYFKGIYAKNSVMLEWRTASESNNDFFEIERSTQYQEFVPIGRVEGSGNSTSILDYQFIDNQPENGINYYRLKQVDYDGELEYSPIVVINTISKNEPELTIFPVPVDKYLQIKTNVPLGNVSVSFYNLAGRQVKVNVRDFKNIDVSDLPAGLYFIRIDTPVESFKRRFIKE